MNKHSAEWYDVAINSTIKNCSQLVKFLIVESVSDMIT